MENVVSNYEYIFCIWMLAFFPVSATVDSCLKIQPKQLLSHNMFFVLQNDFMSKNFREHYGSQEIKRRRTVSELKNTTEIQPSSVQRPNN